MNLKMNVNYSLYLVTDRDILKGKDLFKSIEDAIIGGVTIVQIREKNISSLEFYNIAKKAKMVTDKYNIPLIINDRIDIAIAVDASGVHLGQQDLPAIVARNLIGKNKILGISVSNLELALKAEKDTADYIGVGAVFNTNTKKNTNKVSLDVLKQIKSCVNIPVVAIGGINETNIKSIQKTNVDGIAVVSAILGKDDIKNASKNISTIINRR
ncbi:thiamine-phosphate diphosphorylase [Alkalithermobacter thermoalcaliphilus JW-YL-7 = DSM 7308]|uniref:Thiamine-phosphate synthase n=2 Tax=Clostridium paradoxum TaxID=29346 RepID=A0A150FQ48_CLOPD|nr:Thiamine-phosphate pyrophosphorylase [[Clostridium] paradoxum JW-YL-7 = DSM 7308]SHK55585.1 thiamine-phosphate diphosphorylase [[Clostridium] paradoxum JW-YL-7 = DSM 7308]